MTQQKGFGPFDTPLSKGAVSAANAKGSLGQLGVSAMNRCKNYVPTGDPVKDQECAGVNFMANNCIQPNATQRKIISGASNAPVASGNCGGSYGSGAGSFDLSSQDNSMISNFGNAANGTAPSSCVTVDKIVRPAVSQKFTCTKNVVYTEANCTQDLNPSCSFVGSPITSMSTAGPTNVSQESPGLYNYSISCGWGGGQTCYGSITFNLDAPSQGAYITANSSSLDDTAVIAVNGIVVFYGHPNSGGSWYYPTFGTTAQFVLGYQDTLYQQQCNSYYYDGECADSSTIAIATSQYKLSDSCPIGGDYSNKTGSQATWCTADGKLVGRIVEGNYYGGIALAGKLPLQAGINTIQMFGGTESGPYSGGITLTGQIYNVSPVCTTPWIDNCTPYEQSSGVQIGNPE